jgi:hypothetical protein
MAVQKNFLSVDSEKVQLRESRIMSPVRRSASVPTVQAQSLKGEILFFELAQ